MILVWLFTHDYAGDPEKVVKSSLPWVHVVIGECRNGIAATHKEIDGRFLQLYLNEYCWKTNRRFFRDSTDSKYDLFDRLVNIAAIYTSDIKLNGETILMLRKKRIATSKMRSETYHHIDLFRTQLERKMKILKKTTKKICCLKKKCYLCNRV